MTHEIASRLASLAKLRETREDMTVSAMTGSQAFAWTDLIWLM
jgi:hypothetical protein